MSTTEGPSALPWGLHISDIRIVQEVLLDGLLAVRSCFAHELPPFGLFGLEMGIAPVKPLGRERLILGRLSSGIRAISRTTTSISTQAGMKLVSSVPERIAIRSCTLRRGYCAASLHRHHGSTGRPNGSRPPTQAKGYG
jgi:hypothetical protein